MPASPAAVGKTGRKQIVNTGMPAFVERYSDEMHDLETRFAEASWELETTSSEIAKKKVVDLEVRYNAIFQRPEDWEKIRSYYADRDTIQNQGLRRQVEHLYYRFAGNQDIPDRVARMAQLSADIAADFTSFRSMVAGEELSDNDVNELLRTSTDSETVREAWKAGKRIGPVVADRVVSLAELRNEGARELGYRDFYAMSLDLQEIDESFLFQLLSTLEELTREPFARLKSRLDVRLSERFGLSVPDLRPWHYSNPFFQEPPPLTGVTLDPLFAGTDVVDLSIAAFDRLGLDVRDIIDRSDLYERPGKNQHAFCIHVDALTDDVRILCNVRPDTYWANTMLHELGHGVYDKYLSHDLPFLLRHPAHTNSTEGIAMLMGRLTHNRDWLRLVAGAPNEEADRLGSAAQLDLQFQMLTFVRWALVMTNFEKALYENPRRSDLNHVWWDLVHRYQLLEIPKGRTEGDGLPDWAAKIHIALYPVYYHNYVLGELTASQVQHRLTETDGGSPWFDKAASGTFLREELFDLGATYPWNVTIERVTGEPLKPDYFVEQFVRPAA